VQLLTLQCGLRLFGHLCQHVPVMPLVCDLIHYNQVGFGINQALNTVADMPAMLRASCHGAGIGIGERNQPVRSIGQLLFHRQ
jgi:hypothetical protein